MLCHVMCHVLALKVMLCHFVYVTLYYLMSVTLLSCCFHFGIDGMSAETRCTWSRSKHPNINAQGCLYKISHQRRQLHRRSTVWTKANGFLSSRPVIPTEPGPRMSIPHKLQGCIYKNCCHSYFALCNRWRTLRRTKGMPV